jgi:anhydro-N-acetylmuramic acid kinase
MNKPLRAIGLMSGTSVDAIDAAIIETDGINIFSLGESFALPIDKELSKSIKNLQNDTRDLLDIENQITKLHAETVKLLLKKSKLKPSDIDLIGFHGQTIIHAPNRGITQQIGDGSLLAELTNINVICDFRRRDVAAGGQGAPLAPLYHASLIKDLSKPIAVINIGGVSNITYINDNAEQIIAFDIGPGNALIDDFIFSRTGDTYDSNGNIAKSGVIHEKIVEKLLSNSFFNTPPPKSLDRNHFANNLVTGLNSNDGAATLTAFTAKAIAQCIKFLPQKPKLWLISGGGRHNKTLMQYLSNYIESEVQAIEALKINGDFIEAQAFGFLAVRSYYKLHLSLPTTTGVGRLVTGGAFYQA